MRLPGTEEWASDAVSSRIAFERNVADVSVSLMTETAISKNFANSDELGHLLPTDSIFALGRAAELAFGTDNFELGFKICRELIDHEHAAPRTPLQFAFYATIGALLQSFKVVLHPYGAFISGARDVPPDVIKRRFYRGLDQIAWPIDSSTQTAKLLRLLLPAAAASGLSREAMEVLSSNTGESRMKFSVIAAVSASPEYEVVTAWQGPQMDFERLMAIESLEISYHRQLRLLRSDVFYWRTLRPRGSIIDWVLLALWVAMLRFGDGHAALERISATSDEARYIRSLAIDFVARTSEGAPTTGVG